MNVLHFWHKVRIMAVNASVDKNVRDTIVNEHTSPWTLPKLQYKSIYEKLIVFRNFRLDLGFPLSTGNRVSMFLLKRVGISETSYSRPVPSKSIKYIIESETIYAQTGIIGTYTLYLGSRYFLSIRRRREVKQHQSSVEW